MPSEQLGYIATDSPFRCSSSVESAVQDSRRKSVETAETSASAFERSEKGYSLAFAPFCFVKLSIRSFTAVIRS